MTKCRFQYSLCRIVYCCARRRDKHSEFTGGFNIRSVESCTAAAAATSWTWPYSLFQYSLCRIVYCCIDPLYSQIAPSEVSIFALSNRVLLPAFLLLCAACALAFQYSLCRIVYCCRTTNIPSCSTIAVSIFALSNRVLLRRQTLSRRCTC